MKTKSFFSLIVFVFLSCIKVAAYTERNFLQHVAAQESLAECLVLNQKWVQYPSYKDREGWSRFLGEYKDEKGFTQEILELPTYLNNWANLIEKISLLIYSFQMKNIKRLNQNLVFHNKMIFC